MTHTKKERVLIDVDGVLRDYVSSLNAVYLREFPDHTIKPVTDWALEHFYPIGKEIYQFMDGQFAREILENAPAYPGEIDALRQFENDFEIVIVTAQPPAHRYPTMVWLGKNDVPANEIHIEHEKQRVPGLALLDDFTVNLEKFQKLDGWPFASTARGTSNGKDRACARLRNFLPCLKHSNPNPALIRIPCLPEISLLKITGWRYGLLKHILCETSLWGAYIRPILFKLITKYSSNVSKLLFIL